ncbi:TadE/TadG family type IV pilus assembly protein [Streptomyces sp. NPDC048142]|uniref:TadE/TadG family type IV pilus assembly protein n=1 Tax=Streptomyces sp. NPDC048142 TaxID=3365501 RepID=UPI00371B292D
MTTTRTARSGIRGRINALRDRRDGDRGQTAVEFLGMTPFIILIMLVLWECALIGYTFSLAGNAADVGARKGSGAEYGSEAACEAGATKDLPDAWSENADVSCGHSGDLYKATVTLKVPVLVPGLFALDTEIEGEAGSPRED